MATKQNVTGDDKQTSSNQDDLNAPTPKSALTNGQVDGRDVREPSVGEPVNTSFDERTSVTQPFVLSDGTQDNGAAHPENAEGARATVSREGDNTAVEDSKTAVANGDIEGKVKPADEADETPKNPVK